MATSFFLFKRPISPFENRLKIWQKALVAVGKKPILGWGLENFEMAFNSTLTPKDFDFKNIRIDKAHNEILEIAATSGLVGLATYLFILAIAFKNLAKGENLWKKANFTALIAYLAIGQLNVLSTNEYLFLWLALSSAY